MLGRFLWSSGSAGSSPRAMRCLEREGSILVVALCEDEMVRVWGVEGHLLFESEIDQRDVSSAAFGLEIVENILFLQMGNQLHRAKLTLSPTPTLTYIGSMTVPGAKLRHFTIANDTIWAAVSEDEEIISVLSCQLNHPLWVEVAPARPPPETLPPGLRSNKGF